MRRPEAGDRDGRAIQQRAGLGQAIPDTRRFRMGSAMRLNEQRKEALLENASMLHSGKGLRAPRLKRSRTDVWMLLLSFLAAGGLIAWGLFGA